MPEPGAVLICTAPRSGSTLLCDLLAAAGAGVPGSWFHGPDPAGWRAAHGLPPVDDPWGRTALSETVAAGIDAGMADGLFALRVQAGGRAALMRALAILHPGLPDDRARIEAAFGPTRFIRLTRHDVAAQAVSLVRARQTGLWHRNADGTERERLAPPRPPAFVLPDLRAAHATLTRWNAEWDAWLEAEGIAPLSLTYEALSADPAMAANRVLRHLDLPPRTDAAPATARLADAVSADWTARLRADLAGE